MQNKVSKKREQVAKRIIEAIKASNGLLTVAARNANVSHSTILRYVKDYPSVKEAVTEARETMLDFAEGKLAQKIRDGDTTALIFFLKTQGKSRGYVERQELTGEAGQPMKIQINVVSEKAKELTEKLIKDG